MQVKQFRQATVREALRAVRADLGPAAVVLSTAMVPARGWRGWLGLREVQLSAGVTGAAAPGRPAANLRRPADTSASRDGIVARLLASGLTRSMADAVADQMSPSEHRGASLRELQRALAVHMEAFTAGDEPYARVEVFIGPPGVGKTTTIAKIAAQERALRGRTLGLVGADAFRAGAVEQLRAYAHIIGAPFRVARTLEDLDQAMTRGRNTLLVDTAGRSPQDGGLRELRRLLGNRRGVRTHLVMAADTSVPSARRILDAYYDARPDRLVITKVDEAESLAPLLSVLTERRIPVSYITAGQRVPEDLDRATAAGLAAAVLRDGSAWAAIACQTT
jgi:flagellar biosynthesis protein FlhF